MSCFSGVRSDYHTLITSIIIKALSIPKSCVSAPISPPKSGDHVKVEGFWLQKGSIPPVVSDEFVLTHSVKKNLKNLVRVVSARYKMCILGFDLAILISGIFLYYFKVPLLLAKRV